MHVDHNQHNSKIKKRAANKSKLERSKVEHGKLEHNKLEKIAKVIAARGFSSRRDAEKLIEKGLVKVNGNIIHTPAERVLTDAYIEISGKVLAAKEKTRVWLFYKPIGAITTARDPQGRATVFDLLPKDLPRVISVGRLDINSEGLLILTNDGALARRLELPSSKIMRTYKVRVFGNFTTDIIKKIENGIKIGGIQYGKIKIEFLTNYINNIDSKESVVKNRWLLLSLWEGKNREIRKIFEYFGLKVNRLIRVSYGALSLDQLKPKEIKEVPEHIVQNLLSTTNNI